MRKLQTSDIFVALRLIKKSNLREELKPLIKLANEKGVSIEDVGIEGILSLLEILSAKNCEQAFYEFLAGPFEITSKEVEELDIETLLSKLGDMARENDLKRFFTSLVGLVSKS